MMLIPARVRCPERGEFKSRVTPLAMQHYLLTLDTFGIGLMYDFWTLNAQIRELNLKQQGR